MQRHPRGCCRCARSWSAADRQSSIGSGFLVSARRPRNHQLPRRLAGRARAQDLPARIRAARTAASGELKLLAIDLPNDLAVVRARPAGCAVLRLRRGGDGARLAERRAPLFHGQSARPRLHDRRGHLQRAGRAELTTSASISPARSTPGMSGGPAVTATAVSSASTSPSGPAASSLSFLVPARFAAALLQRARDDRALEPAHRLPRGDRAPARRLAVRALQVGRRGGIPHDRLRAVSGARDGGAVVHVLGADQCGRGPEAPRRPQLDDVQKQYHPVRRQRSHHRPHSAQPLLRQGRRPQ